MSHALFELMHGRRDDLIETVVRRLRSSTAPHYQNLDPDLLRGRSERLVDTFLTALDDAPADFVRFIRRISEERISEGFFLPEIQTALNILEERAWQVAAAEAPAGDAEALVRDLGLITGTIGAAKDQLARIYLQRKEQAESRADRLQARLDELFKGTDAPPLVEDDALPPAGED